MNLGRRAAERSGRLIGGLGIFGAAATGALIGMSGAPVAHADTSDAAVPVVPVTPESLLSSSTDNLTAADTILGRADLSGEFQGILGPQTEVLNNGLSVVGEFEGIQAPLLSSGEPSLANLGDLLFLGDDQQIEQASADVLSATQAFDANPTVSTEFNLFLADAQLGGAAFDTLVPNAIASFVDQLSGIGSDATGSAASVADLFSLF